MSDTEAQELELTERQERFCREYIKDLNGKQAALRAGYSEDSATEQASRLLSKDHVWARVQELKEVQAKRVEINADEILLELKRLALADISQAFDEVGGLKPLKEIPEDVRRSISGLEVNELFEGSGDQKTAIGIARKVKFWDKNKALENLGKHLKLFTEKHEHTGKDGGPIAVNLSEISDEELQAKIATLLGTQNQQKENG